MICCGLPTFAMLAGSTFCAKCCLGMPCPFVRIMPSLMCGYMFRSACCEVSAAWKKPAVAIGSVAGS